MRRTEETTLGINWNPVELEEEWEDVDEEIEISNTESLTLKKSSAGNCPSCKSSERQSGTGLRKVTIYLPFEMFENLKDQKKRKQIHSYSDAIATALQHTC